MMKTEISFFIARARTLGFLFGYKEQHQKSEENKGYSEIGFYSDSIYIYCRMEAGVLPFADICYEDGIIYLSVPFTLLYETLVDMHNWHKTL